jgi:hypothetical protein
MDNKTMQLILVELNSCVQYVRCWATWWYLQKSASLPLPSISVPNTYLQKEQSESLKMEKKLFDRDDLGK